MQPTKYLFAPRRPQPAEDSAPRRRSNGQSRPSETAAHQDRTEPGAERRFERSERSDQPQDARRPAGPRPERQRTDAGQPRSDADSRAAAMRQDRARAEGQGRSDAPWSDRPRDARRNPAGPATMSGPRRSSAPAFDGPNRSGSPRTAAPQARPQPRPAHLAQPMRQPQPSAPTQPVPEARFRELPASAELTSFAELKLSPETRVAVDAMGISVPTPIQAQAIPIMLAGDDVVGQARTGSGKTLAFSLPLVERIDPAARGVQALVLVPTRELAIQVGDVIEKLARARRLKLTLLYGGRSLIPEARALAGGAQIVVGTPGRTLDHIRQGNLHLQTLKVFVLDEGDEMLDRGFAPDVERIMSRTPATRQTALFSATVPPWVMQTAARHLHDPALVRVDTNEAPPEIEHIVYDVDPNTRSLALRTLLDRRGDGPIIVFGRTKHGVKKLARQLETEGFPVVALHGNLSQKARERAMADLRSGSLPILVATNVAARGIDVADVGQVINYEVPESAELFTHRVGRTGRMGKSGEAITFVTPEEAPKWRQIERVLGKALPRQPWTIDGEPVPVSQERTVEAPRPAAAQMDRPNDENRRPRWRRGGRPSGPRPGR